jgi:hypothetical protein
LDQAMEGLRKASWQSESISVCFTYVVSVHELLDPGRGPAKVVRTAVTLGTLRKGTPLALGRA